MLISCIQNCRILHRTVSRNVAEKFFQDYARVFVTGGQGGAGVSLFLSLYANEYAGSSGGDGGNGGHVILEASNSVKSLAGFRKCLTGPSGSKGSHGAAGSKDGAHASHRVVHVPCGTIVKEKGVQLIDLKRDGDRYIAARGGIGGLGNRSFTTSVDTAPDKSSPGSRGECRELELELSIVADVGLVGFPNAGKSSLLRCISNATPLVANFPFTTLNPHIGIVEYDDASQIAVADIPGIIRGAHLNKGLGLSFLRHIRRCTSLVYVLDVSVPSYLKQLEYLKLELEQYQPGLSTVPNMVVANKTDTEEGAHNLKNLKKKLAAKDETCTQVVGVSALYKLNIDTLIDRLRNLHLSQRPNE